MPSSPDPIQAQLIVARRNQILAAATQVFAEKGFHSTTIKDIAGKAGIAHGTIYNYFENKTALMLGIFDRLNETGQRNEDFAQSSAGDFRSFMKAYLRHRLIYVQQDNFEMLKVVLAEVLINKELRELFYQKILEPNFLIVEPYFQQLAAQHIVKPVNSSLAMRAISGIVLGLIIENILGDQTLKSKWDELPDFLTDLILDGIGAVNYDNSTS
ncbi:MAG TPA: TetR/AcrR family transcriptional regulator [Ktedonobacteraceae bacterium]